MVRRSRQRSALPHDRPVLLSAHSDVVAFPTTISKAKDLRLIAVTDLFLYTTGPTHPSYNTFLKLSQDIRFTADKLILFDLDTDRI